MIAKVDFKITAKGRINRLTLLTSLFAQTLILCIASIGIFLAGSHGLPWIILITSPLIYVWFLISGTSLAIRRIQDTGHSQWWLLLPIAIAVAIAIPLVLMGKSMSESLTDLLIGIPIFYLLIWPGTKGENKYGLPPAR